VRRREFITLLGGAAIWPLAARAQPLATTLIGFLGSGSPQTYVDRLVAIRQGLKETGFVEGQNLAIEYRWADGRLDQLPALAADLAGRQVRIIVASGGSPAPLAAKAATSTIPIVFSTDGDPVKEGLVASLNRPGGNATGVTVLTTSLAAKRLEIFDEVVPKANAIAVLINPTNAEGIEQARDAEAAARALAQRIHVLNVSSQGDIEPAFAAMVEMRIAALMVTASPLFVAQREQIVRLAQRNAIAAMYGRRDFVAIGGLMSYGANLTELYRQLGLYTGRILKGEKPAELPVMQPTKFELAINLKTAKALGLTVPPALLARADEVIE
jgi:putative ABC transport system substrate-binding protein